jgi:hypothetical protein
MKRILMSVAVLLVGSSFAMGQAPQYGVGAKNTPPAAAATAYGGAAFPGNPEALGVPRVEIFGSYSLAVPAPSWGLPGNAHGIDTSASINLNRWFAVEGDFGWNREATTVAGITETDRSMVFSGGPRFSYRQGRLDVFGHFLFGVNRLTASIPSLSLFGVSIPSTSVADTSLAALAGGGADIEITRHVALRNQADYLPTHHLKQMQNNHRFSFGIVVKF